MSSNQNPYQALFEHLQTILNQSRYWPTDADAHEVVRKTVVDLTRIIGRAPQDVRARMKDRNVRRFIEALAGPHPEWRKKGAIINPSDFVDEQAGGVALLACSGQEGLQDVVKKAQELLDRWKRVENIALPLAGLKGDGSRQGDATGSGKEAEKKGSEAEVEVEENRSMEESQRENNEDERETLEEAGRLEDDSK
ncbi:hypothetical protein BKA70DRAFT_1427630 [Coprinopsis sp. MPI-PUGE-AT-0042]|nr:hypothetical protein BKA70DRAFT_1427630 [Coprinopsis sp. MPI-PUGE-AT-0042]